MTTSDARGTTRKAAESPSPLSAALLGALWDSARNGKFVNALLIFEQLQVASCGEPPSLDAWNGLLRAAVQNGDNDIAAAVLERMAFSGHPVGDATTVHLRLLSTLGSGRRTVWKAAASQLGAATAAGVRVSSVTYAALVQAMAHGGALVEAVSLVSSLLPPHVLDAPPVHQALMLGALRARAPREALRTWERYLARSAAGSALPPTQDMCNLALDACAQIAKERGVSASGPKTGALTQRHANDDSAAASAATATATGIIGRMREWGLGGNELTYGAYIQLLLNRGRVEEAEGVPDMMRNDLGLQPSAGVYTKLAAGLVEAGHPVRAVETFRRMVAAGLAPTVVTYTVLLTACARMGRMGQAAKLLARMGDTGTRPTGNTANVLLSGLLGRGRRDLAARLVEALPALGLQPDEVTARTLAHDAAGRAGDFAEAVDVLIIALPLFPPTSLPRTLRGVEARCRAALESERSGKSAGLGADSRAPLSAAAGGQSAERQWDDAGLGYARALQSALSLGAASPPYSIASVDEIRGGLKLAAALLVECGDGAVIDAADFRAPVTLESGSVQQARQALRALRAIQDLTVNATGSTGRDGRSTSSSQPGPSPKQALSPQGVKAVAEWRRRWANGARDA